MRRIHRTASTRDVCRLATLFLLAAALRLCAYEHLTIESTSHGDGRFDYRLTMHDDPFLLTDDTLAFGVVATGVVEVTVTPPGWSVDLTPSVVTWISNFGISYTNHMSRPAQYEFGLRSSFLAHRSSASFGASTVYGSLRPISMPGFFDGIIGSMNILYYVSLNAVVPCPPDQADGSPAQHKEVYEMFSSLMIDSFYKREGELHGLYVRYDPSGYTAVVRARRHNQDPWTDIEQFKGQAGVTCWVSDLPLKYYGNYFCAALLSFESGLLNCPLEQPGELSNTLSATSLSPTLPFRLAHQPDGKLRVSFESELNASYRVQLGVLPHGVQTEMIVTGTGRRVETFFDAPPHAASVRVTRVE